ncbi:ATP-dependent zinc metalloprotease FTSH 9, chloroplastic/mitochondrial, partial [Mucuna pruriens]
MGIGEDINLLYYGGNLLTAYHESGHAIVALNTEGAHPIHKATIMPRGSALGMVTQLPSSDETSISKKQLLARLDVCMGGRVAEELIFGQDNVTTGASSDLHTATELAQYMVSNCGMSDAIGPVHIKERPSSEMQSRIDAEASVVKLLREAYDRVKALLKKHEKALHVLANALLEYETLSAEEIRRILLPYREGRLPEQQEQEAAEGDLVLGKRCTVYLQALQFPSFVHAILVEKRYTTYDICEATIPAYNGKGQLLEYYRPSCGVRAIFFGENYFNAYCLYASVRGQETSKIPH